MKMKTNTRGTPNLLPDSRQDICQAAIFDLDGVVVDTAKYHYLAWKRLARKFGYYLTEKDNELFKGVSRIKCMDILAAMTELELTAEQKNELSDLKNSWYVEYISGMERDEILPGFLEFHEELHKNGFKTALASSSRNTPIVLERLQLTHFFDVVVDGNDIQYSKPHPQIFEIAAMRLRAHPEHCIVFEDAQAGIDAAKEAGMSCVGIGASGSLIGADLVIPGFVGFTSKEVRSIINPS